jgi:hypothetical protein
MKIWRRTNPNNIDVGNKLGTELFRALIRGVADRNDSDVLHFVQRRQVALFDDIPGADETYIQFSATHWHGNAVSDKRNDRLFDAIDNFLRWPPESLARSPELRLTMLVTDRKRETGICMVFSSPYQIKIV